MRNHIIMVFYITLLSISTFVLADWTYNPFTEQLDYYMTNVSCPSNCSGSGGGNTTQEIINAINVTDSYFDIIVKRSQQIYNSSYEWFKNTTIFLNYNSTYDTYSTSAYQRMNRLMTGSTTKPTSNYYWTVRSMGVDSGDVIDFSTSENPHSTFPTGSNWTWSCSSYRSRNSQQYASWLYMANNGGDTNCSLIYNSSRVLTYGYFDLVLSIIPDYSLTQDCVLLRVRYYATQDLNSTTAWRGYDWYYNYTKVQQGMFTDAVHVKTSYGSGLDWNTTGTYYKENIWYPAVTQKVSIQDTGSNIFYQWGVADSPRPSFMGSAGTPIGKMKYARVTFMPNCPASSSGWKEIMVDSVSMS